MISPKYVFSVLLMLVTLACGRETYTQGKRIYDAYCLQCHMSDGNGLGDLYPALNGSSYLSENIGELPCLIRNGKQSEQLNTVYMPAHKTLGPADLTNLINYMSATWGIENVVQIADVTDQMSNCP